jgi:hypothetical protein
MVDPRELTSLDWFKITSLGDADNPKDLLKPDLFAEGFEIGDQRCDLR